MKSSTLSHSLSAFSAITLGLSLVVTPAAHGQAKPRIFAQAESVTAADPNAIMHATVWLKMHNQSQLDAIVAKIYDEKSTTYHQWLKPADLTPYTPTSADAQTLKRQLTGEGLTVISTGANNMFVKVSGTVSALQTAFHTEIKSLNVKGQMLHAATTEPKVEGASAGMVSAVTGLTPHLRKPHSIRAVDPETGKSFPGVAVGSPNGIFFASECFRGVESHTFKAPGTKLPIGEYIGNRYGADITNSALGTLPPCGYDAANVTTAYGMPAAYAKGLDGTGQTIVIVDAYGSSTIRNDGNTFSKLNKLPPLGYPAFEIFYPEGHPDQTTADNAAGWAEETSLDVEWAHALAPGANIDLIVAASNDDSDLEEAVLYAIFGQKGSVISNSYGSPEAEDIVYDPQDLFISSLISEIGAGFGISVNYSSGDDGDFEAAVGVKTVSAESASPYATSVGGTSLAITSANKMKFQTGWGNNFTKLASYTLAPVIPPLHEGFNGGSGGGESMVFDKPSWQSALPGTGRQQPDISLVADPFTGVEFVFTDAGGQELGVIGGTSLACPAFSAIWAIANQQAAIKHGKGTLLGQAAPIIASLSGTPALTDVTDYSSPTNVTGLTITSTGVTYYSPDSLAEPLENTRGYLSDLYNSPFSGSWYTLTFGTDSSLVTGPGWDNVTGYGTPNGLKFITAAAK